MIKERIRGAYAVGIRTATVMDVNQLQELLAQVENPKLEFKRSWYSSKELDDKGWGELLKDLAGLANGNIGYVGKTAYMIVGAGDEDPEDGEPRSTFNIDEREIFSSMKASSLQKIRERLIRKFRENFSPPSCDIKINFVQWSESQKLLVIEIQPPSDVLKLDRDLTTRGIKFKKGTVLIRADQDISVADPAEINALKSEYNKLYQTSPKKVKQNLPQPDYGKFIGREEELSKAMRILRPYPHSQHSLVTIDGVGGIGKSALALEIAHRFLREHDKLPPEERFDALIWTSAKQTVLRSGRGIVTRQQALRTLDDICESIAVTLEIEEKIGSHLRNQVELIRRYLSQQRTLLIVDNLETVDDEAVIEFLQEIPAPTKVIVTTRHRIDVAYPVRLVGMKWEDSKILIEQECVKKEVILAEEQKKKLHDRTGGVPLAIVWSIAEIGFGYSVDAVLVKLGNPQGDIARFCFEGVVEKIKNTDAYKLLLVLALFEDSGSREELGHVAGFADDLISRDEGLVQLEKLSLVNKKADEFSILPLTREYAEYELGLSPSFAREAAYRLIDYYLKRDRPYKAEKYLLNQKSKLSNENVEKFLDLVLEQIWQIADSCMNISTGPYTPWEEYYMAAKDLDYICLQRIGTMESIGETEGTQKLKQSLSKIFEYDYFIIYCDIYYCGGGNLYEEINGPLPNYINALERLDEYDFLIEILANNRYREYAADTSFQYYAADEIIQAIEKSGRKDLIQPLDNILSKETDSRMVAKLQQAIERLESTN